MEIEKDYLEHHGILGQRWGIRRFQNKDGSLTKAGQKRYAKLEEELNKLKIPTKSSNLSNEEHNNQNTTSKSSNLSKKKFKDLSNEELKALIDRRKLEDDYKSLYNSEKVKKGKGAVGKFASFIVNKMVVPAAEDIGKQVVKSYMADGANKLFNLEGDAKVFANNKKKS